MWAIVANGFLVIDIFTDFEKCLYYGVEMKAFHCLSANTRQGLHYILICYSKNVERKKKKKKNRIIETVKKQKSMTPIICGPVRGKFVISEKTQKITGVI